MRLRLHDMETCSISVTVIPLSLNHGCDVAFPTVPFLCARCPTLFRRLWIFCCCIRDRTLSPTLGGTAPFAFPQERSAVGACKREVPCPPSTGTGDCIRTEHFPMPRAPPGDAIRVEGQGSSCIDMEAGTSPNVSIELGRAYAMPACFTPTVRPNARERWVCCLASIFIPGVMAPSTLYFVLVLLIISVLFLFEWLQTGYYGTVKNNQYIINAVFSNNTCLGTSTSFRRLALTSSTLTTPSLARAVPSSKRTRRWSAVIGIEDRIHNTTQNGQRSTTDAFGTPPVP